MKSYSASGIKDESEGDPKNLSNAPGSYLDEAKSLVRIFNKELNEFKALLEEFKSKYPELARKYKLITPKEYIF